MPTQKLCLPTQPVEVQSSQIFVFWVMQSMGDKYNQWIELSPPLPRLRLEVVSWRYSGYYGPGPDTIPRVNTGS